MVLTGFLAMAYLPWFPIHPAPLAQDWHNSWLAESCCAIVNQGNVPKDLPTGDAIGHLLNCGFLFPDESSLCHNNKKLTSTKGILMRVGDRGQWWRHFSMQKTFKNGFYLNCSL